MTHEPPRATPARDLTSAIKTTLSADGVLEVTLNRPLVHNAINDELSSRLLTALKDAHDRDSARAVIIRGEGQSFSSGQDLKEAASYQHISRLQNICRALRAGPPAIAVVQGHAIGGGAEIAFACDFILASRRATFRLPEVELGLAPGGGVTLFLATAVGPARAARLLLLGEELSAEEALGAGLVFSLADEGQLLAEARELAGTLAQYDPSVLERAKQCLRSAWEDLYETAYKTELEAMVETSNTRWSPSTRRKADDNPESPSIDHGSPLSPE